MAKGKQGLYEAIRDVTGENGEWDFIQSRLTRDMSGPTLIVKYLNDDEEWEAYLVTAERVN